MRKNAVLGPGVCAGMGTANTMHLACEALGLALPGSTPVRANSEPMWRVVEQAARRIVEMTGEDLKPRDILTPAAFANAVTAVLSVSGSINSVKHLQAVAAEAECGADVYRLFETLADRVPLLAAVRPNGEVPIEAFEDAGGTRALLKQLEPLLDGDALTVTGRTLAQNLAEVTVADSEVIRPPDRAHWMPGPAGVKRMRDGADTMPSRITRCTAGAAGPTLGSRRLGASGQLGPRSRWCRAEGCHGP